MKYSTECICIRVDTWVIKWKVHEESTGERRRVRRAKEERGKKVQVSQKYQRRSDVSVISLSTVVCSSQQKPGEKKRRRDERVSDDDSLLLLSLEKKSSID